MREVRARFTNTSHPCISIQSKIREYKTLAILTALQSRWKNVALSLKKRFSRYYDQHKELINSNQQDRKAEHEGSIRDYRAKAKEARLEARKTDDLMEHLKLETEARK